MTTLGLGLVLVGALGLLNLLLTFGVIRRLRQDAGSHPQGAAGLPPAMAPVGTVVRDTPLDWDGETLVGFFSPGCAPCEQQVPDFVAHARTRQRVVAVVLDRPGETAELVRQLGQAAQVVVEAGDGVLQRAFEVEAYPSYCVVRDGVVSSVVRRATDLAKQVARIPA